MNTENTIKIEGLKCEKTAPAIGPYSKATKVNISPNTYMIFTSGSIGVTEKGDLISDNVGEQTKQALENLKHLLEENNCSMDCISKATIFLIDMGDFKAVNDVYTTYFKNVLPARSCVAVAGLPKNSKVEIECVAFTNK